MSELEKKILDRLENFFRYYREVDSEPDIKWEKVNELKKDINEIFKEEEN